MAKEFTKQQFEEEVLNAEGAVLVDFWATWCMPCKMQGPTIDQLAQEGFPVGKVDVDKEPELAAKYRVMSVPTLIVFKGGKEVKRMVGVQSKEALKEALANA